MINWLSVFLLIISTTDKLPDEGEVYNSTFWQSILEDILPLVFRNSVYLISTSPTPPPATRFMNE